MKIHIDIDCFFVSAARIEDPSLKNKAVAIGGRSDTKIFSNDAKKQCVDFSNSGSFVPTFYKHYERDDDINAFKESNGKIRGILTTSSYEARAYGVKTAMSIREALMLCPHLIIKSPNMTLYQKLSRKLFEYLQAKIPLVEQASIDEFYGDVSGWIEEEAIFDFIIKLKEDIQKDILLPVSIGAAPTRYIAKLATTSAKPYGCRVISQDAVVSFIEDIPVEKFAGIGKSMQAKLFSSHIHTLGELKRSKGRVESWGPYSKELYKRVCGLSDKSIETNHTRKSIGISRTFDPIYNREEILRRVHILARHLSYGVMKLDVIPTVFSLTISYETRQSSHKNISLAEIFTQQKFHKLCTDMFRDADINRQLHIIRLSINCSSFTKESKKELSLLGFYEDQKMHKLTKTTQQLQEKYGLDILKFGSEIS